MIFNLILANQNEVACGKWRLPFPRQDAGWFISVSSLQLVFFLLRTQGG